MSTLYDRRLNDNWIENYAAVDYLVVAGGGGGGAGICGAGGGGAGGYRASGYGPSPTQGCTLNTQWGTHAVTVGGGGAGGTGPCGSPTKGVDGDDSVFFNNNFKRRWWWRWNTFSRGYFKWKSWRFRRGCFLLWS